MEIMLGGALAVVAAGWLALLSVGLTNARSTQRDRDRAMIQTIKRVEELEIWRDRQDDEEADFARECKAKELAALPEAERAASIENALLVAENKG